MTVRIATLPTPTEYMSPEVALRTAIMRALGISEPPLPDSRLLEEERLATLTQHQIVRAVFHPRIRAQLEAKTRAAHLFFEIPELLAEALERPDLMAMMRAARMRIETMRIDLEPLLDFIDALPGGASLNDAQGRVDRINLYRTYVWACDNDLWAHAAAKLVEQKLAARGVLLFRHAARSHVLRALEKELAGWSRAPKGAGSDPIVYFAARPGLDWRDLDRILAATRAQEVDRASLVRSWASRWLDTTPGAADQTIVLHREAYRIGSVALSTIARPHGGLDALLAALEKRDVAARHPPDRLMLDAFRVVASNDGTFDGATRTLERTLKAVRMAGNLRTEAYLHAWLAPMLKTWARRPSRADGVRRLAILAGELELVGLWSIASARLGVGAQLEAFTTNRLEQVLRGGWVRKWMRSPEIRRGARGIAGRHAGAVHKIVQRVVGGAGVTRRLLQTIDDLARAPGSVTPRELDILSKNAERSYLRHHLLVIRAVAAVDRAFQLKQGPEIERVGPLEHEIGRVAGECAVQDLRDALIRAQFDAMMT